MSFTWKRSVLHVISIEETRSSIYSFLEKTLIKETVVKCSLLIYSMKTWWVPNTCSSSNNFFARFHLTHQATCNIPSHCFRTSSSISNALCISPFSFFFLLSLYLHFCNINNWLFYYIFILWYASILSLIWFLNMI